MPTLSNHNLSTFENPFPILFEIVPPEKGKVEKRLEQHTSYLKQLFDEIEVEALNIPEIQDESSKSDKGKRRTPAKERVSPRKYAHALSKQFDTNFIINRVIVNQQPSKQEKWMAETYEEFDIDSIILVGGESSHKKYEGPSVAAGNNIVKEYLNRGRLKYRNAEIPPTDYKVGNICIPTRRREEFDEPERMYQKICTGADFFTSQIVAERESPVSLMKDLSDILLEEDMEPPMIFWSFSPISSQKDVDFMRWLGVEIPEKTEQLILGNSDPATASAEVAQTIWDHMLDFNEQLPVSFPMGINISVMGLRNFENGIQLAKELDMVGIPD